MPLAYLSCRDALPDHRERRGDAHEHDLMMNVLRPAAASTGTSIEALAWDDPEADWSSYDAAIIGTTWDYWDHVPRYLDALERIGGACPLFNDLDRVRWNIDKRYLADLEQRGVPSVPTMWAEHVDASLVAEAFAHFETDRLVVKRQVGAGAYGQVRLRRGEPVPAFDRPMLVQPFLPSIQAEGEQSLVYIDGSLSHALRKRAQPGDYRIQSLYGGFEEPLEVSVEARALGQQVIDVVSEPERPVYARVDLVRRRDGALALIELELIEPYLYPKQGPEVGERLVNAVVARL